MKKLETVFVDSNVFLRFFVGDIKEQFISAKKFFEGAAKGEISLVTSELVIAEIVWVLESFYNFSHLEVSNILKVLLNSDYLNITNSHIIEHSLENYLNENVDFIDAFNHALMINKSLTRIATFDVKHFKRMKDVEIEKL